MSARVILLTGPSGSGKTSLLRRVGARRLKLDDFYRHGDAPHMPTLDGGDTGPQGVTQSEAMSIVDWDHPASWDADKALAAINELCSQGRTSVPVYDISANAALTEEEMTLDGDAIFVAEGIFAAELVDRCRDQGVLADALVLHRPTIQTWWFRLRRDLKETRKPLPVLLSRGLRLARAERGQIARWTAQGCRPVNRGECEAAIRQHLS